MGNDRYRPSTPEELQKMNARLSTRLG